jgi:hypothetical protein
MLTMRMSPNASVSPDASRNRIIASETPLRMLTTQKVMSGYEL